MILWLDLETTGLSPSKDVILEFAAVLSTDRGEPVSPYYSRLVQPANRRALLDMDRFVVDMHQKSGLMAAVVESIVKSDALCIEELEVEFRMWLLDMTDNAGVDSKQVLLGGNSVHFDRAFLDVHAPSIPRQLSHRHIDVSTLTAIARFANPEVYARRPAAGETQHRAMADVFQSMATYKHYLDKLIIRPDQPEDLTNSPEA